MGCDIHLITEIKKNGKWHFIEDRPLAFLDRDYSLFALLADVRNYFNFKSFQQKGLPEDMSGKKFFFKSEKPMYNEIFNEGTWMFVGDDGKIIPHLYDCNCVVHLTKEQYDSLYKQQKENPDEFSVRYQNLGYSFAHGVYDYTVLDATVANGKFAKIPWSRVYDDFESYMKNENAEEWDEDAQDYGYWGIDFNNCEKYGDYHTPNWLTLQELLTQDVSSYTSNRYKMSRFFYEHFINAGGKLPDVFSIEGDTVPNDIRDCFAEAFEPTIIVSWQKSEDEKKCLPFFKGIEELKEIAQKYNIEDYNDIRIVFAFDN